MDLGAAVCRPTPVCAECPVESDVPLGVAQGWPAPDPAVGSAGRQQHADRASRAATARPAAGCSPELVGGAAPAGEFRPADPGRASSPTASSSSTPASPPCPDPPVVRRSARARLGAIPFAHPIGIAPRRLRRDVSRRSADRDGCQRCSTDRIRSAVLAGRARDGSIGESHDDPSGGRQFGIALDGRARTGRRSSPWVAQPSHSSTIGVPIDPEVDLPTLDDLVEVDGRQAVPDTSAVHRPFEERVGRARVDRPCVDSGTQRGDATRPGTTVHVQTPLRACRATATGRRARGRPRRRRRPGRPLPRSHRVRTMLVHRMFICRCGVQMVRSVPVGGRGRRAGSRQALTVGSR